MNEMLGNAGRPSEYPARPPHIPLEDEDGSVSSPEGSWRPALPPQCLRVLSSPHGAQCPQATCQGIQADGGCLADLVRRAQANSIAWEFEVDSHGRWCYSGPALP